MPELEQVVERFGDVSSADRISGSQVVKSPVSLQKKNNLTLFLITARKQICGKVMFSVVSVH